MKQNKETMRVLTQQEFQMVSGGESKSDSHIVTATPNNRYGGPLMVTLIGRLYGPFGCYFG